MVHMICHAVISLNKLGLIRTVEWKKEKTNKRQAKWSLCVKLCEAGFHQLATFSPIFLLYRKYILYSGGWTEKIPGTEISRGPSNGKVPKSLWFSESVVAVKRCLFTIDQVFQRSVFQCIWHRSSLFIFFRQQVNATGETQRLHIYRKSV